VLGFSRALAAETRGRLGVTTLIPAGMRTGFFDDRPEQYRPAPDAQLVDPSDVARAVVFALQQPPHCEVRELVICPEEEPSWP
jgi:NADP-dependent 3-hydroxy acid dehydrogenase YdfG